MTLGIDFAWQHPNPADIKTAGYSFVMRYLSDDPTKNITADEANALHAARLGVGLVVENAAQSLLQPAATLQAWSQRMNGLADDIGFPHDLPLYWAADWDVLPSQRLAVRAALAIVAFVGRPAGLYGPRLCVEEALALGAAVAGWQAGGSSAWEGGANGVVSQTCQLYQRLTPTLSIAGMTAGSFDEDVLLNQPAGIWGADIPPAPPPPSPITNTDKDLGIVEQRLISIPCAGGDGWLPGPTFNIPINKICGILVGGAAPQRDNTYWGGTVAVNNTDGLAEFSAVGWKIGIPGSEQPFNGSATFYVNVIS